MKYIVIATVNKRDYLTRVEAESLLSAEHMILDRGICTSIGYGVDAAMAYDSKSMKTDCFIGAALAAEPIDYYKLIDVIEIHNECVREKAAAHDRIIEIEKQMKELAKELESAKKIVAA